MWNTSYCITWQLLQKKRTSTLLQRTVKESETFYNFDVETYHKWRGNLLCIKRNVQGVQHMKRKPPVHKEECTSHKEETYCKWRTNYLCINRKPTAQEEETYCTWSGIYHTWRENLPLMQTKPTVHEEKNYRTWRGNLWYIIRNSALPHMKRKPSVQKEEMCCTWRENFLCIKRTCTVHEEETFGA